MCNLGPINLDWELSLKCKIYRYVLIITTRLKMRSRAVNFHPLAVYNRMRGIIRALFQKHSPERMKILVLHTALQKWDLIRLELFYFYNYFVLNFSYHNTSRKAEII
jgi:hypothetical protein